MIERKQNTSRNTSPYIDKVISISRVTKVTKGGRTMRFSATVVIGDKKGAIGLGTGKSTDIPDAIRKAIQAAQKNITNVNLVEERTISHEAIGKCGAAKVLIKPARAGAGIVAGGPVRSVLELAGVRDVVSKSLGSNTQFNTAKATLDALKQQKTLHQVASLRGKTVEEIVG